MLDPGKAVYAGGGRPVLAILPVLGGYQKGRNSSRTGVSSEMKDGWEREKDEGKEGAPAKSGTLLSYHDKPI